MADSVCLAYVHDLDVTYSFHDSLINLLMLDVANHGRILNGGYVAVRCARSSDLVDARNQAIEGFLARDADWLFFVDTDMGFTPDTVERLLAVADKTDRPIVGGLCFAQRETTPDGMSGYRTTPRFTILDWVDTDDGPRFMGRANYPVNAVVQCAATGAACILIHRTVLQRMRDEMGPTWYNRIPGTDGKLLGEDISFCVRAGILDVPVHVHTGVKTTHLKNVWLQEADFWQRVTMPPATQRTAVIVPVMQRPANAKPFMESLRASTGLAEVYAVADIGDTDTINAWKAEHAIVLVTAGETPGTFAEKVNIGYRESQQPWLFLTGDDVRFHAGWLDHAQAVAGEQFHVVGTNDLANPRVVAGEHATHMLIRRSYVDEHGASWDGPGVVAHQGYRHWYVDDEIVTAAKQRDAWAMALGAIVEHRHPMFGTAESDAVYELGQSRAATDRKTFRARCRKHADSTKG